MRPMGGDDPAGRRRQQSGSVAAAAPSAPHPNTPAHLRCAHWACASSLSASAGFRAQPSAGRALGARTDRVNAARSIRWPPPRPPGVQPLQPLLPPPPPPPPPPPLQRTCPLPPWSIPPTRALQEATWTDVMDVTPQLDAVLRCLSGGGRGLPDEVALTVATTALDGAAVRALPRVHELSVQQRIRLHRCATRACMLCTPCICSCSSWPKHSPHPPCLLAPSLMQQAGAAGSEPRGAGAAAAGAAAPQSVRQRGSDIPTAGLRLPVQRRPNSRRHQLLRPRRAAAAVQRSAAAGQRARGAAAPGCSGPRHRGPDVAPVSGAHAAECGHS